MTAVDDQGRPEPPPAAGEVATLLGFLEYQRATLAWKCAGLDAAGLNTRMPVRRSPSADCSSISPSRGRLVPRSLHGRATGPPPWDAVDWEVDPDWEWRRRPTTRRRSFRAVGGGRGRARGRVAGRWPRGDWIRWPGGRGGTAAHRACAGSWSHDRGVRPAQRPRRPAARGDRRPNGGVNLGRTVNGGPAGRLPSVLVAGDGVRPAISP